MDDLETNCLEELQTERNISPLFYFRYVDHTVLCVRGRPTDGDHLILSDEHTV